MKARLAGTNDFSLIDGIGVAFVVYFQGCTFNCKGCHNKDLQNLDGGELVEVGDLLNKILENADAYDSVVYQGGEPTLQKEPLLEIMREVKKEGLYNVVYTGLDYVDIDKEIWDLSDMVVAGLYVEELKTGGFPASSNQKIIRRSSV